MKKNDIPVSGQEWDEKKKSTYDNVKLNLRIRKREKSEFLGVRDSIS